MYFRNYCTAVLTFYLVSNWYRFTNIVHIDCVVCVIEPRMLIYIVHAHVLVRHVHGQAKQGFSVLFVYPCIACVM